METVVMSWVDIEKKYDGNWVLLVDTTVNEVTQVTSGRVIYHHPLQDEVWNYARNHRSELPRRIGVLRAGRPKERRCYAF